MGVCLGTNALSSKLAFLISFSTSVVSKLTVFVMARFTQAPRCKILERTVITALNLCKHATRYFHCCSCPCLQHILLVYAVPAMTALYVCASNSDGPIASLHYPPWSDMRIRTISAIAGKKLAAACLRMRLCDCIECWTSRACEGGCVAMTLGTGCNMHGHVGNSCMSR